MCLFIDYIVFSILHMDARSKEVTEDHLSKIGQRLIFRYIMICKKQASIIEILVHSYCGEVLIGRILDSGFVH